MLRKRLFITLGLGVSTMLSGGLQAAQVDLSPAVALTSINTTNVADVRVAVEARKWVALDQDQEPGSEARVELNRKASNKRRSVFDITIPGFWMTGKKGDDGQIYQQIEIPGLGSHDELGQPDLPRYKFHLALPFSKGKVSMRGEVQELRRFQDILVWPQSVPELDGEKDTGTPEQFVLDRETYAGKGSWPGTFSPESYEIGKALRGIPAIHGEAWPVQWDPSSRELQVAGKITYILDHDGDEEQFEPITQERFKLAELTFINWEILEPVFGPNLWFYTADYLFIYPDSSYADEIKPLVDQKKARGFKVTEMNVADDIGASTCNTIRTAIQTWEAAIPFSRDAYALLVGDTDVIPHCTSPDGDQTDDSYASTDGDDLNEEIYLGRLSVDSEADLANQVSKILTYEDHPSPFCCYNRAGLWAHKENAPGKYEGAHETVRTFAYADAPIFETFYGSQTGVTDSDVANRVSNGVGVMAYRGHGSSGSTATSWNQTSEYFNGLDVSTLSNPLSRSPVVWSFACTNSKLDENDSIAEKWMELADAGSSSYYGATRTSYTDQNHVLDEWMFRAVYDEGLLTQSHAIERGEAQMAALIGARNAWMYLLLGDPDMKIRTKNPYTITIKIPELIEICKFCELPIQVLDEVGNPLPNALVGLWKPSQRDLPNMEGETWVNGYTDEKGLITLPYSALTEGELYYSVEDGAGNAVFEKIQVVK
ncbi:C25 family cysteine peptidase [Candidatus Thiodiazotropha sp. CDECU1]|uniref:C25 family cysteine peptidase n=1 Tax=Candidatus Thiodiazotropha sp. CDECU1 TaxID=3065865 RepID=UPI00292E0748|nr:C25 family cysteine peptidase [Candidatus Thiodiazotropha sp. CDECU1]